MIPAIPAIDPWVWVLLALVFQPLIALLWAYLLIRGIIAYTTGRIENAVERRISQVTEQFD